MSDSPSGHVIARLARKFLVGLLGLETLLGVISLVPLLIGFAESGDELLVQRVSILLTGVLAIVWIAITFFGALRGRSGWPRASAITIHVLMFAAGTGMLQYGLAPFWMSAGVILLSLVGFFAALLARAPEESPHSAG